MNVATKLAGARVGEFFRLQDGNVVEFRASQSLIKTAQTAEDEIVRLARNGT